MVALIDDNVMDLSIIPGMVQFVRCLHVCESFSLSSAARRIRDR